jgi:hypothetical protein
MNLLLGAVRVEEVVPAGRRKIHAGVSRAWLPA